MLRVLDNISRAWAAMTARSTVANEHTDRETRLMAVINSALDAIVGMDADGRVTDWNHHAEAMFGYARAEIVGRALSVAIVPERFRAAHEQGLRRFLDTGAGNVVNRRVEITALHRDGHEFPVELTVSPMRIGGATSFTAFVRDITERRRLEEQALQMETLRAVGRLAGGIAHDFNNLLTAIHGCTDLLDDSLDPSSRARTEVAIIRDAARRGAELTRQLLAYSRNQVLKPIVLDVARMVTDMAPLLRRLAGESRTVELSLRPDPLAVRVDPGQFEQVLVNLVLNARDAMPDGGKVTIASACVELGESRAQGHVIVEGGSYVVISVRDTGVGMDDDTKAHLFEPFYTTKPPGKGTGLGLATVYGIVKQSGGYIVAESTPGKGAEFSVYLPRCDEMPAVEQTAATPAASRSQARETILLVEDESTVREVSRRGLQARGYDVIAVGSAAEALSLVERGERPVHALVSDVSMEGMSGPELAARLRTRMPDLAVLLMSGLPDEYAVGDAEVPFDYLQKPFTFEQFERQLQTQLGTRSPLS